MRMRKKELINYEKTTRLCIAFVHQYVRVGGHLHVWQEI